FFIFQYFSFPARHIIYPVQGISYTFPLDVLPCFQINFQKGGAFMAYYPVLVNRSHLLPPDYIPDDLEEAGIPFCAPPGSEKRLLRRKASKAAGRLFTQAALDKMGIIGISGYRSYKQQEELYLDALPRKMYAVAAPGASEHQTGFALDLSCPEVHLELEESSAETPEGRWLEKHAPRYGSVIRYPTPKENIPGFPWEPWHIRYVGEPLALY